MAIRQIRQEGDPILKKKSRIVENIDERIQVLIDDMIETMNKYNGVGLAAVQVGVLKQVLVIDIDDGNGPVAMINPVILKTKGAEPMEEGCLSFPNKFAKVIRPTEVQVEYTNREGKRVKEKAKELYAQAIAHEVDHLNGEVFVDKHYSKKRENYRLYECDKITPIVSKADYDKVQELCAQRCDDLKNPQKGKKVSRSKYNQLLYCYNCGAHYIRNTDWYDEKKTRKYFFYNCEHRFALYVSMKYPRLSPWSVGWIRHSPAIPPTFFFTSICPIVSPPAPMRRHTVSPRLSMRAAAQIRFLLAFAYPAGNSAGVWQGFSHTPQS